MILHRSLSSNLRDAVKVFQFDGCKHVSCKVKHCYVKRLHMLILPLGSIVSGETGCCSKKYKDITICQKIYFRPANVRKHELLSIERLHRLFLPLTYDDHCRKKVLV